VPHLTPTHSCARPGVLWPDMHRLADRSNLEGLRRLGLLQGEIDEMMEHDIGALFMPHGASFRAGSADWAREP
jgi:Xaa-Pro dipeptidase